ncbi:hypothetical protein GLOTRDRAFT_135000 [Gloeophyllum trabeum ATCC 11539]|uniref:BTB domain-containing protein n=1 Tax=Gloeophyllum trabeum (strain ATCC 11539 / FP-39264 / Madison 617) TaxID=670483 RepID=S7RZ67_GLOTA|nr:uncharacterized protein GLOTRDRAFT_135000 [Gloeophyllum trabeum ATCC 11539]EPQ60290.1 hypothetical protein GLOTRDRAFT_135000 [Gloeophyllum trabeum ATCC 11539]
MGDDLNPLKRPRIQDASPSDSIVDVKKHPSLYLSDGNIVLYSAASEGEAVAFCVHRSMLSKVSLIFADMFSLPPSDVNEQHEGRPVVRMQDRASDLEQLLKILYHESSLPMKRLDPQFPSEVKPILQLANKYEITSLRGQIVSRLTEDWPTTLREWDALEKDIATMRETWDERLDYTASGSDFSLDSHLPEPVGALHLAKECEVPQILPAVFYHLSRLSFSFLFSWAGNARSFFVSPNGS